MTTFTRVMINPGKRQGRDLLLNPQAMHAAVRALFPPDLRADEGRVLWRVDSSGAHTHLLYVVSPEVPDAAELVERAGWVTRPAQVADYRPMLDGLRTGQEWAFRLRANPVCSQPHAQGPRGKVLPHVTVAQQTQWLVDRGGRNGFEVLSDAATPPDGGEEVVVHRVAVTERRDLRFGRYDPRHDRRGRVTLRQAQFDGVLRVTNPDLLRSALINGIGRGKAYGCGLLTLARSGL
ncbi:type I-E CRISPR-associated protein Cas6/Cse3/CasE [Actinomyces bowdenii]|uniref:Type I-E CRISPR-associated protein Cas6/Cse3/CasE n=1 Tax=Actinomyces bowdenii TaxID=131109 RepID=A0A3P1UVG8_9ACTO|nr:type I-E CRISPR-associated protein Cas6/Cse3/CasE [Actinomyces bowdenii]MBO3724630.1 type I-E CRISPR-associated protein Cas6/Cse3/CasE [Actinomyces bowdenii]RRD25155.1 type I-E CRISPR-associated protein Cas6/Cse3/CasE [Actinomyces bowdenii]